MASNQQSSTSGTSRSQKISQNQPQTLDENTRLSPMLEQAVRVIDKHREIRANMEARHMREMREQEDHFQGRIKHLEGLLETGFEATMFELQIKNRDKILASKQEHCENTQSLNHSFTTTKHRSKI